MKLTELEKIVLESTLAFCNYDDPEVEKFDNAVIFNIRDLHLETDIGASALKGIVGSLYKKGFMEDMEGGAMKEIGLTDQGIETAFELGLEFA